MTAVTNGILDEVKQMLGVDTDDNSFDLEITLYINAAFSRLNSLGVGPSGGYMITGPANLWSEFIRGRTDINQVKQYVSMKCRLAFDPPPTSFGLDNITKMVSEMEVILNMTVESYPSVDEGAVWYKVKDGEAFPEDAPIGAFGYDPETNHVWQKTS